MNRIIAIGDIHGCCEEFKELLSKLEITDQDHLIFLGDLVNRGPDSRGVLDIVHDLPNKTLIMGNHELRLLKYHNDPDSVKLKPYDAQTLAILEEKDWELIHTMVPFYHDKEHDTVFVHGGFEPDKSWHEQPLETVARIQVVDETGRGRKRSKRPDCPLWSDFWHGPPFVVYGHLPKQEPIRAAWSLGIDTACVWGGSLTAYILPSKELVSIPAKKAYLVK